MGPTPALIAFARAFAIASMAHLLLPDVAQEGWLFPALLEGVGAFWLLLRPHPVAFLLCASGTLWPLLFLRDVLTQSALLTVWAVLGAAACRLRWRRAALDGVVWVTAATYGLAALHKLNDGFFDPAISCAPHAMAQIHAVFGIGDAEWLRSVAPYAAVGVELTLAALIYVRSPLRWPLAVIFHLPLTVTLAPAFGLVMSAGLVAASSAREAVYWRRLWRLRRREAAAVFTLGALFWWAFQGAATDWHTPLKVGAYGVVLVGALSVPLTLRQPRWALAPALIAVVWVMHGLTPYLGVQYQHTGAMLSNLRIDAGCHNSWIFPESWRGPDPYIRIDSASIGAGQRPKRERVLVEGLWSRPALHTMHRNWCIPELRPIRLAGTVDGRAFVIEDLCAAGWTQALPGGPGWPGFQRFQKNLKRTCQAACVH